MRVEVSNLAAANFNFQSIPSSKSLFAENSTECPQESQSRRKREQKFSSRKSRKKTQCSRKREVHSSTHCVNLEKLSAVAVGERREEEKKEERKRWRHHLNHQSYVCEKICKKTI
jgi:hypothetical protein